MKIIVLKLTLIFFLLMNFLHAKSDYFSEGVNLYKKEKFKEKQNSKVDVLLSKRWKVQKIKLISPEMWKFEKVRMSIFANVQES